MDLLGQFRHHLATLPLPEGRALVAVSGGPDSVVLLDLLRRSTDLHRLDLVVAHFNHGISPASDEVATAVQALAESYGLAFEWARGALGVHAGETAARAARYAWLESVRVRQRAHSVFTAHHADDQIETILMRLLAGSGPAGLAGMAPVSGTLVRPLLPFRREALVHYARDAGLTVWLDPANHDPRHLRSWVRCELLPGLRVRLPATDAALLRAGSQAARDRTAWDAVLELLPGLEPRSEDRGISVAGASLAGYDSALAETVLMAMARRVGCRVGPARAERLLELARHGGSGAVVPLGGEWKAELAFGRLRLLRSPASEHLASADSWSLEGDSGEGAWGGWRIRWSREPAPEFQARAALSAWFAPDALSVRRWLPGEKVRPLAGVGRRLIVRCFQDARIPRTRRSEWPVLARQEDVVWVPGVCRSDALLPARGTEALRVDAEYA
jgi:tRNA(Ile)-lysidine synthase